MKIDESSNFAAQQKPLLTLLLLSSMILKVQSSLDELQEQLKSIEERREKLITGYSQDSDSVWQIHSRYAS